MIPRERPHLVIVRRDDDYERDRNALIPIAEAAANNAVGKRPKDFEQPEIWGRKWNSIFHSTMNKLAKERL